MKSLYNGQYAEKLYDLFGKEILSSENDLLPEFRIKKEIKRMIRNRNYGLYFSEPEIWKPGHILFLLTNKCNLKCDHCYTFAGPEIEESLSYKKITRFMNSSHTQSINSISISGGEVFLYDDIFLFLSKFPVSSVVTNGQWATNMTVARTKAQAFKKAVLKQSKGKINPIDFCLSTDQFHTHNTASRIDKILNVIQAFSELDIGLNIKLFTFCNTHETNSTKHFIQAFRKRFSDRIALPVSDTFDCSYSGRAVLLKNLRDFPKKNPNRLCHYKPYVDTGTKYQYVINARGGIALYDVLNIAPYPFLSGDITNDSPKDVMLNLSSDPIANLIRQIGTKAFLQIMAKKVPIVKKITQFSHTSQQALYLSLLNSSTSETINMLSRKLLSQKKQII